MSSGNSRIYHLRKVRILAKNDRPRYLHPGKPISADIQFIMTSLEIMIDVASRADVRATSIQLNELFKEG